MAREKSAGSGGGKLGGVSCDTASVETGLARVMTHERVCCVGCPRMIAGELREYCLLYCLCVCVSCKVVYSCNGVLTWVSVRCARPLRLVPCSCV